MKTEGLLNVDYTKEENKILIQKALKMIKPLSKYSDEDVPQVAIEKFIHQVYMRYKVKPGLIRIDSYSNDKYDIWSYMVYSLQVGKNVLYEDIIDGMCIYEVLAKVAIRMWSDIKNGKYVRR